MKFTSLIILASTGALQSLATRVAYDPAYEQGGQSLSTVACSDGTNGLLTRGFTTFGSLPTFPYIGAAEAVASWDSPNCGTCWQLTYEVTPGTSNTITVTAIDHADSGFNVATSALNNLTDGQAVQLGQVDAVAVQVPASACGL